MKKELLEKGEKVPCNLDLKSRYIEVLKTVNSTLKVCYWDERFLDAIIRRKAQKVFDVSSTSTASSIPDAKAI